MRCARSVRGIKRVLEEGGWAVERQEKKSVGGSVGDERKWRVDDGVWEVGNVRRGQEGELQRAREEEGSYSAVLGAHKRRNVLELMYDALDLSLENVKGGAKGVGTLDVWVSVLRWRGEGFEDVDRTGMENC